MDTPTSPLKQAHLPSALVNTTDSDMNHLPENQKKRKHSDGISDLNSPRSNAKLKKCSDDEVLNTSMPSQNSNQDTDLEHNSIMSTLKTMENSKKFFERFLSKTSSPVKQTILTEKCGNLQNNSLKQEMECTSIQDELTDQKNKTELALQTSVSGEETEYVNHTSATDLSYKDSADESENNSSSPRSCSAVDTSIKSNEESGNVDNDCIIISEDMKQEKQNVTNQNPIRKESRKGELKEQRKKIRQAAKECRERERLEAKANKQREKEEQLCQKLEKKKREEQERQEKLKQKEDERVKKLKQKEELRLEKLKQKEEKLQQKQQVLESKLEEKKKKEEERQKKLDEKKKIEEEKQKKLDEKKKAEEEVEKKKEKVKAAFASFFVKTEPAVSQQVEPQEGLFLPFEVTKDMKVASPVPSVASTKFNQEKFERSIASQDEVTLYINEIRNRKHKPYTLKYELKTTAANNNNNNDAEDDSIVIDGPDIKDKETILHTKLLQFCDNIRPPYWGTWRKKSKLITGKKPLQKDVAHFEYDVDSDEEWDEGGPGESLSDTEGEKESEDDYEVDNDFFVPHGYLSDDEANDDGAQVTPETKNALLKMKEIEFIDERSKKCLELKPKIISTFQGNGLFSWTETTKAFLEMFTPIILSDVPISTTNVLLVNDDAQVESNNSTLNSSGEINTKAPPVKQPVPEEAIPHLIKLVHGNTLGRRTVIKEFQEFWQQHCKEKSPSPVHKNTQSTVPSGTECSSKNLVTPPRLKRESPTSKIGQISKRQLDRTLQKIAEWCRPQCAAVNKYCWWVHEEIRQQYNLVDLPMPNNWQYITITVKNDPKKSIDSTANNTCSIKKYSKHISKTS